MTLLLLPRYDESFKLLDGLVDDPEHESLSEEGVDQDKAYCHVHLGEADLAAGDMKAANEPTVLSRLARRPKGISRGKLTI